MCFVKSIQILPQIKISSTNKLYSKKQKKKKIHTQNKKRKIQIFNTFYPHFPIFHTNRDNRIALKVQTICKKSSIFYVFNSYFRYKKQVKKKSRKHQNKLKKKLVHFRWFCDCFNHFLCVHFFFIAVICSAIFIMGFFPPPIYVSIFSFKDKLEIANKTSQKKKNFFK